MVNCGVNGELLMLAQISPNQLRDSRTVSTTMEATESHFSSTQRLKQLPTANNPSVATQQAWLQERLYQEPANSWQTLVRLLRPRFSLALVTPLLCGALMGWWQTNDTNLWTVGLLLLGGVATVLGLNLLHEYHDFWHARKHNDVQFHLTIFATPFHLMATEHIRLPFIKYSSYALLTIGLLAYLGLVAQMGWPLMFFYTLSLLLIYTYSAPPIRYGYRGWGLGEIGLFLGYGFFPLLGSYYIVGRVLDWSALLTTIPFGLAATGLFVCYNFIHHHRDWLMRKRTLVVNVGPKRALDINALFTLLIYALFLAIVSLAHLPLIVLITLAGLPLATRIYGRLRAEEQIGLEDSFLLYRSTVTATLWMSLLFAIALLMDKYL